MEYVLSFSDKTAYIMNPVNVVKVGRRAKRKK